MGTATSMGPASAGPTVRRVDIGLFSDDPGSPAFYTDEVGLAYIEALVHSPTYQERFWDVGGSTLKINHSTEPMPPGHSGYRGLVLARSGITEPRVQVDPHGIEVCTAPPGHLGVARLGIICAVEDVAAQRRFLAEGFGGEEHAGGVRLGDTDLLLRGAERDSPGPATPVWSRGFNYLAMIVDDAMGVHRSLLDAGATPGVRPMRLGDRCLFIWVRDPHGNWIELVQYGPGEGPFREGGAPGVELPDVDLLSDHWPEITRWREQGTPI